MEKVTLKVMLCEISWENIHFRGLKKNTLICHGRKIKANCSKKYVKFFSSGYYFPSYISPLKLVSTCCSLLNRGYVKKASSTKQDGRKLSTLHFDYFVIAY